MSVLTAAILCAIGGLSGNHSAAISHKFEGVWRISAVVDCDGIEYKRTEETEQDFVRQFGAEFLIIRNRLVAVARDGETVMCYATVERVSPDLKLRLRTAPAHDAGAEEILYAVLRQSGDDVFLWLSEDASIVGQKDADGQYRYTLRQ